VKNARKNISAPDVVFCWTFFFTKIFFGIFEIGQNFVFPIGVTRVWNFTKMFKKFELGGAVTYCANGILSDQYCDLKTPAIFIFSRSDTKEITVGYHPIKLFKTNDCNQDYDNVSTWKFGYFKNWANNFVKKHSRLVFSRLHLCSCEQAAFIDSSTVDEIQESVILLGGPKLESLSSLRIWCCFATSVFLVCIILMHWVSVFCFMLAKRNKSNGEFFCF